jgi:hypothetical protein
VGRFYSSTSVRRMQGYAADARAVLLSFVALPKLLMIVPNGNLLVFASRSIISADLFASFCDIVEE